MGRVSTKTPPPIVSESQMEVVHADRDSGNSTNPPGLLPQHLDDLRASGLTDETIRACRFRSDTDPHVIKALLGHHLSTKTAAKLGACLVLPYYGPGGEPLTYLGRDGEARTFVRVKPDKPREDMRNDRRKVKYESPAGAPSRAYIPPTTRAALSDPSSPLLITEGEKKAACADQHGFACVGLGGVWSWQVARPKDEHGKGTGPRELIPDLEAVAWTRRPVYIVSTPTSRKPEVQWANGTPRSVSVVPWCAVRLPGGPDGRRSARRLPRRQRPRGTPN